jgi:integrase
MARHVRASNLETRTSRLKLPVAKKPLFAKIGPGISLGYRRNRTAGTWVARVADGKGGNWTKGIAKADDFEDANGTSHLDFWQAQDRAKTLARGGGDGDEVKPLTVAQALDKYEVDLRRRGGDVRNVARVRAHLSPTLAAKTVPLLGFRDLRQWRDGLANNGLAAASANRSASVFKAALNLAASHDTRIASRSPWEAGLASLPDAEKSRNVILPEEAIIKIINSAYENVDNEFGLLVEVAAVTGARVSQLAGLEGRDLQGDRADPRLTMPTSRKGRGRKRIDRRPVPITRTLAERLQQAAAGRPGEAPLLTKSDGSPWRQSDHTRPFRRAVSHAGLDPTAVTIYALRHSAIVRALLANVPIRVVASSHDSSVLIIEKTYSRFITDHSDALSRRALLETAISDDARSFRLMVVR